MPVSPYIRLDSSQSQERSWMVSPIRSDTILRCEGDTLITTLRCGGETVGSWSDPLAALHWLDTEGRARAGSRGRWVGFISYDLGRLFETIPVRAIDDLRTPLFAFAACSQYQMSDIDADTRSNLASPVAIPFLEYRGREQVSTLDPDEYRAAVVKAIEYIRAGDIFQVNLSQRYTVAQPAGAVSIYAKLLRSTPAAYGALLDFGDFALICNSPELFLHVTADPESGKRRVVTRPIKGTRPRISGMEKQLRESAKDQAELHMIIDLERNDLGRVCEIGSVRVTQPRTIETHPTVYHGVATVEGVLRDDVGLVDLLHATFPGGSITGAPKIRAMQIIEELEPVRRGPYCGAIGYLGHDGSMQFNVAIRTMIVKDNQVHIPVGGGIVADSEPDAEYEETLVKARAMFAALGVRLDKTP